MKVKVRLYATFSRFHPGRLAGTPFEVELADGATLHDLIQQLAIPPDEVKVCFVNARIMDLDTKLKDGDEIGIFPPVGGG
ncbi:MAG: MoaD/ThiS family protein [Chloroflexota bacterium]